jgi:methylmalonyl-CoA mutase N-terminal domain/subunit
MGGMARAIENGYIQKEIQDAAYRYQKEVESSERIVVGVNKFTVEEDGPKDLLRVNPKLREVQIEKLQAVKASRNQAAVDAKLKALAEAAKGDTNLMPLILDAVREYASLGEISNVLRDEFGEYEESIVL